jgi:hypothetical protein
VDAGLAGRCWVDDAQERSLQIRTCPRRHRALSSGGGVSVPHVR